MGYDVHITRKRNWFDDEPKITMAEWLAYLESDATMRLDGYAEATTPNGDTLRYENEGLAVWIGYSRHHPQQQIIAWFDFWKGDIAVKNPDEEIRRKMWLIAQVLDAKVQGDDGEIYGAHGNVI